MPEVGLSGLRADAAEHEAAHVVVGLALGLRLRKAAIGYAEQGDWYVHGFTWFRGSTPHRLALGIMYAAGVAWESSKGRPAWGEVDRKEARRWLTKSRHDFATAVRLADELLRARRAAHARVARELCDRDLGPADVERLVVGE